MPDSTIVVRAIDDFRVNSVKVTIKNAAGVPVEEGDAVQISGLDWLYTATEVNNQFAGSRITATAVDLPNNSATLETTL